jgi:hypothetical protein
MSPTHPFRTSRRSPHDDNGPNSAALRRSLASLQTHDRDTPLARRSLGEGGSPPARVSAEIQRRPAQGPSVEIPSVSEEVRRPTVEIRMQEIPRQTEQKHASQETLATEPLPETQPRTIDSLQAESHEAPETGDEQT